MRIKVSAAMLRLPFHGCDPAFIRDVCHAKCCDAPSRPAGMLVSILPAETTAIESRGATVVDGLLQPAAGCRGCPFKTPAHLCRLHGTPDKPHGCKASPFMLNASGTLIVRNRYKRLPCFKADGAQPAYRAFADSLAAAIGDAADLVTVRLDAGLGDALIDIDDGLAAKLSGREAILHGGAR